jgi:hypothetical protein
MKSLMRTLVLTSWLGVVAPLAAQSNGNGTPSAKPTTDSVAPAPKAPKAPAVSMFRSTEIQHFRQADQRGINVYEWPKNDSTPFTGFQIRFGGAFVQEFQNLTHENTAAPKVVGGVNANQLMAISPGYTNSVANMTLDAQVADGIRVTMTSYLSARHHNETWVKDGYILIDKSPIDLPILNDLMQYVTLRVGQFETNYGDAHFRRTDNGNGFYNPFVGNLIIDAQTTEVGAEIYGRREGWLAMVGFTNGESKGSVITPTRRTAAYTGKLGWDGQVNKDLRVRLTGSLYTISKANNNVLYTGDRGGSRYYYIMENTAATDAAQAWSGNLQPGFGHNVTAMVVNPFVKYQGLEVQGHFESAKGRSWAETENRTWTQNAFEALYRFGGSDRFFLAGRYNTVSGKLVGITNEVSIDRTQLGFGWFVTPNVQLKLENVVQNYTDFPSSDIRNGGKFKGFMIQGLVAF